MHPPPSHVKSKSALLAASSSGGIYLSCFEGKYIASVLDLLPLEEGVALVPTCIRRPNRWKWRCRRLIPLIMSSLLENMNAPSSAYSDRKNWKIFTYLRLFAKKNHAIKQE